MHGNEALTFVSSNSEREGWMPYFGEAMNDERSSITLEMCVLHIMTIKVIGVRGWMKQVERWSR